MSFVPGRNGEYNVGYIYTFIIFCIIDENEAQRR